jgi:hypothetical protein
MIGKNSIIMWPVRMVLAYLIFLWWFFRLLIWVVRAIIASCIGLVMTITTVAMIVTLVVAIYKRSLPIFGMAAEYFLVGLGCIAICALLGDVFATRTILAWLRGQQTR